MSENDKALEQIKEDIKNAISKYEFVPIYNESHKEHLKKCIYDNIYHILQSVGLENTYDINVHINENNEGIVNIEARIPFVFIGGKLEI